MHMMKSRAMIAFAGAMLAGLQASAHHSAALFDDQKSVRLSGTVKSFQWTNPHCWIQVLVPGQPDAVEWSVEMGSPSQLYNIGWKPKTLKPGDKIILQIHPSRDGGNAGLFISATNADGTPVAMPL